MGLIPIPTPCPDLTVADDDALPALVRAFVQGPSPGAPLLDHVRRHVARVTRSYPDAWFNLGRKDDDAVADLSHRVFTTCARVPKGRFPFNGRTPFVAFVQEQFDGRAIRYHGFYAKLSITRELMRDDYARNLVRDPVLRWRADLYKQVGAVLKERCVSERLGDDTPLRWRLPDRRVTVARPVEVVQARLQQSGLRTVPELVLAALELGGPQTQSRLTQVVEAVLGTPPAPELDAPVTTAPDHPTTLAVRRAVLEAWRELSPEDRDLLVSLARGDSYDELIARNPAFKHKVAVTRAVARVGKGFVERVVQAAAHESLAPQAELRPKDLVELVLEVLLQVLPELQGEEGP